MTPADGRVIGTTTVLDNGPAASRFNVVVLGDGYQAAQLPQYAADVQQFVNTLVGTPPFDRLRSALNVFRVDVESTDTGARDPVACGGTGAAPRTYFDASFCNAGIRRALVVNNQTAFAVATAQVPQFHLVMVMVNSTVYGGTGGQVAVQSRAPGAAEIALHEMGHTAFGLADEYEYWAGCGFDPPGTHDQHPPGEPAEPNVTLDANTATNKWRDLVLPGTAMPTTQNANCAQCDPQASPVAAAVVGAFEGAHYYHCGAYRPIFTCRMRALGNPFCPVCQTAIERRLAPFLPAGVAYAFASQAFPGAYLRMDGNAVTTPVGPGAGVVNCQAYVGPWEKFVLRRQVDGTVAIESHAFPNVYLRMDGNGVTAPVGPGAGVVNCQAYVGPWEKFRLVPQLDGTVVVASVAFPNVYLRMDGNGVTTPVGPGAGVVNCQAFPGPWERFRLVPQ